MEIPSALGKADRTSTKVVSWLILTEASIILFITLIFLSKPVLAACNQTGNEYNNGTCGSGTFLSTQCIPNGSTVQKGTCGSNPSCPADLPNYCYYLDYTCGSSSEANAFCGIAPPPGGGGGGGGSCSPNCGTYPNCYTCPPTNNYGCSGNSCVAGAGGDAPGCPSSGGCAVQTCNLSVQIQYPNGQNYFEAGQPANFQFNEGGAGNRGYVCLDMKAGGGTVPTCQQYNNGLSSVWCDNANFYAPCHWTYNCTAVSSTPTEYTTYTGTLTSFLPYTDVGSTCPPPSGAQDCSVNFQYVVHGCTKPTAPANPNPNNNATDVSVTPSLRWTQSNWGSRGPYSAMVYLFQGNSSTNATNPYSVCYLDGTDIGAPGNTTPSAPMSCFVWSGNLSGSGYYQGQSVGALKYNTQYSWFVVSYSGCGSQGNDATAFSGPGFITVPQNYFTTYGGNITSHAIISNASLPSNSFVCQKSQ